jgi:hypothetical protein
MYFIGCSYACTICCVVVQVYRYYTVASLLKNTYSKAGVAAHMVLQYPQTHYNPSYPDQPIPDVYSSKCRKEQVLDDRKIMLQPRNVMLALSSDGFCPFDSRPVSVWPITATVNICTYANIFYVLSALCNTSVFRMYFICIF